MKHMRSALKLVAPLALMLAVSTAMSTLARAEWDEYGKNEDGSATLYYNDSTGQFAVVIEKNGKYGVYFDKGVVEAMLEKIGASNPDPNDPNNGAGTDKPNVVEMAKQAMKDAKAVIVTSPIDSKLGGIIESGGAGKSPHWNPSDDDNKGPSNPPSSKEQKGGLTAEQKANLQKLLNELVRQAALGKAGMYDGSEGGSESAPGITKHSSKNDSNSDSNHKNPYEPQNIPDGEDLGPRPELVNPNPDLKTGRLAGGQTKAQGTVTTKNKIGKIANRHASKSSKSGKSGKSAGTEKIANGNAGNAGTSKGEGKTAQGPDLMTPGLLDSGHGFSFNGPAAGSLAGGRSTRVR